MFRAFSIMYIVFIALGMKAGDSLFIKKKRLIIGLSGYVTGNPLYSNFSNYKITGWHGFKFKGMYKIPGIPNDNVAAGINASFSSFYLSSYMANRSNRSYNDNTSFIYDPNTIKTKNYNGSIGIFIALNRTVKHLYMSHDFGICFTFFTKNNGFITRKETYHSSGSAYELDTISNTYVLHAYDYSSVTYIKQKFNFYNSIVPFYDFELGFRLRNIIPHFGVGVTFYKYFLKIEDDNFTDSYQMQNQVFLRASLGFAFRL